MHGNSPGQDDTRLLRDTISAFTPHAIDEMLVDKAGKVDAERERMVLQRHAKMISEEEELFKEAEEKYKQEKEAKEKENKEKEKEKETSVSVSDEYKLDIQKNGTTDKDKDKDKKDKDKVKEKEKGKEKIKIKDSQEKKEKDSSSIESESSEGTIKPPPTMEEEIIGETKKLQLLSVYEAIETMASSCATTHEKEKLQDLRNKLQVDDEKPADLVIIISLILGQGWGCFVCCCAVFLIVRRFFFEIKKNEKKKMKSHNER